MGNCTVADCTSGGKGGCTQCDGHCSGRPCQGGCGSECSGCTSCSGSCDNSCENTCELNCSNNCDKTCNVNCSSIEQTSMYNQILNIFSRKIKKDEGNLLIKFIYNELDRRGLESHLSSEIKNNDKINNDNINLLADDLELLKHTVKRFNEKTKILLEDIKKYKEAAIACYGVEVSLP